MAPSDDLPVVKSAKPTPAAPVSDGNEEFPVPYSRFAVTLHHTGDEVYLALLQAERGRENHTITEWSAILDAYRGQPAHPDHPGFQG